MSVRRRQQPLRARPACGRDQLRCSRRLAAQVTAPNRRRDRFARPALPGYPRRARRDNCRHHSDVLNDAATLRHAPPISRARAVDSIQISGARARRPWSEKPFARKRRAAFARFIGSGTRIRATVGTRIRATVGTRIRATVGTRIRATVGTAR